MGDAELEARQCLINPEYDPLPTSLLRCLYVGHFLSRWSARMWEFSVALYMINIWPDSLLLTALYGVVESASVALFGPIIGEWVNTLAYVKVLQLWTVSQNLSFIAAGVAVMVLLVYSSLKSIIFTPLVLVTYLSGAVAVLSTLAGTILIEREWVVVMSEDQPTGVLAKLNSVLRRIDLVCKLCAPVVSGFIVSFVSLTASAIFLALWNVVSVCVEYWLLSSVYEGIPALRLKDSNRKQNPSSDPEPSKSISEQNSDLPIENKNNIPSPETHAFGCFSILPCLGAWKVYLNQEVVLPGLSLALLFFTVLRYIFNLTLLIVLGFSLTERNRKNDILCWSSCSFGSLMTAVLEWEGIPAYQIGIARGISAIVGITATFTYPILESKIATLRTGLWSIWSQWSILLICVGSIWVKNKLPSAYMLMSGVAASRLGLWMFDLAVIQQMQDQVPASDRCIVGGVQNSIQSAMDLLGYIMGVIVSNPEHFWVLILISFVIVTSAAILYTLHIWRVRKHLFHFDKLYGLTQRFLGSSS
ncbi:solute carrier family 40 member 1-like isoform X2 [Chenopodium quinoa]|uniref:solute carrier family 40 member 1-like isoform X2 n=1 Tax=Chenopodium quinoa TaxID=63459 RepID=UPI000B77B2ED|nr:solute carrier family 40 member 1-like isoform X2 [Chenopodium quinoa]